MGIGLKIYTIFIKIPARMDKTEADKIREDLERIKRETGKINAAYQLQISSLHERYGIASVAEAKIRDDRNSRRFLLELTIAALERFKLLKQQEIKMTLLNDDIRRHLSPLSGCEKQLKPLKVEIYL